MKKITAILLFALSLAGAFAAKTRVACVGDSITDGFGLANPSQDSWPALLGDMLGEGYDVRNFGQTGKTLQKNGDQSYWDERKYKAALEFEPDIVVIKLGTNDAKEKNWKDPKNFEADLAEFAASFKALPSKPRIYMGTSAWVRKDAIGITGGRVDGGVVPIQKKIAKMGGYKLLDFNSLLRDHPDWYCDDIHPNEKGALEMAKFVYKALRGKNPPPLPKIRGKKSDFNEYERYDFKFRFRDATLFVPANPSKDGAWIWAPARFDGGDKFLHDLYRKFLKDGYYILHTDVDSWLGNPNSIKWGDGVLKYYRDTLGFSGDVNFVAAGTGAIYAVNFAAANPGTVKSLFLISPVYDAAEWAARDGNNMKKFLQEWRLTPEDVPSVEGLGERNLAKIREAGIKMTVMDSEPSGE